MRVPFLPYEVTLRGLRALWWMGASSARLRLAGGEVPRLEGRGADEIALEALRGNAGTVLRAGAGHFRYMWVSDFGKALRGARRALSDDYLRGQVELMARFSAEAGHATSCFDARGGFDMPYPRVDSLPWLILSARELEMRAPALRERLQALLDAFAKTQLRDGLVDPALTGDWMDTVLRPSSTYNNVCVAAMLRAAQELGLRVWEEPEAFERRILERRLKDGALVDYHEADRESVDAPVYALYLGVFERAVRARLADRLEAGGFTRPFPIASASRPYEKRLLPLLTRLTPGYHSAIWLHLGYMYLNGLKSLGRDVSAEKEKLAALIVRHGNIVEALNASGGLYRSPLHVTEHALTMAGGQWLELSAPPRPAGRTASS